MVHYFITYSRKTKHLLDTLVKFPCITAILRAKKTFFATVVFLVGYVETKVIPAGARNIRVEEVASAPNYLALRSSSGKWYLNGDWYIQQSGEYTAGGTTVFYKRTHNKETFQALGPTTDDLHIMVCHNWTAGKQPRPQGEFKDNPLLDNSLCMFSSRFCLTISRYYGEKFYVVNWILGGLKGIKSLVIFLYLVIFFLRKRASGEVFAGKGDVFL